MVYKKYEPEGIKDIEVLLSNIYAKYKCKSILMESKIDEYMTDLECLFIDLLEQIVIVGNEILYLIIGGFFDGAMARMRSLHEYYSIMMFVKYSKDPEKTARKYTFYKVIKDLKLIKNYIDKESISEIKEIFSDISEGEFKSVVFSKNFGNIEYDWAKDDIEKNDKIYLSDIEKFIHDKKIYILNDNGYGLSKDESKFSRCLFKVTSSKVHAGNTEPIKYIPNIIGMNNNEKDDKYILENLKIAIISLQLYLEKIKYALDFKSS